MASGRYSFSIALVLTIAMLFFIQKNVHAEEILIQSEVSGSYLNEDGMAVPIPEGASVPTGDERTLGGAGVAWYFFDGAAVFGNKVNITGDVRIILADNSTTVSNQGFQLDAGSSLTLYAQSAGENTGSFLSDTADILFLMNDDCMLNIYGGTMKSSGEIIHADGNNDDIRIMGGTLLSSRRSVIGFNYFASGKISIGGANTLLESSGPSNTVECGDTPIVITGGVIKASERNSAILTKGSLTINNAFISSYSGTAVNASGDVEVSNSTIESIFLGTPFSHNGTGKTITINDSIISYYSGNGILLTSSSLTINGGSIIRTHNRGLEAILATGNADIKLNGSIMIIGSIDANISTGDVFTLANGSELISNKSFTNNNSFTNDGSFINKGTVVNNGRLKNNGKITNDGVIANGLGAEFTGDGEVTSPVIYDSVFPDASFGQVYNAPVNVNGGAVNLSGSALLPAGLTLDAGTGEITGTPEASGRYEFTLEAVAGNSRFTQECELTVNKLTPELTDLIYDIPIGDVYNGSPQGNISVTDKAGGAILGGIKVLYNNNESAPADAGSYSVTAVVDESANVYAETFELGEYKINKATVFDGELKSAAHSFKNNVLETVSIPLDDLLPIPLNGKSLGTPVSIVIGGDYSPGDITASAEISNNSLIIANKNCPAGKTYYEVIPIVVSSQNYTDISFNVSLISEDNAAVSIVGLSISDSIYNAAPHAGYTGTPEFIGGTPGNAELNVYYSNRAGTPYYGDSNPPVNAGDYTVTVSLDNKQDYSGEWSADFTIHKAEQAALHITGLANSYSYGVSPMTVGYTGGTTRAAVAFTSSDESIARFIDEDTFSIVSTGSFRISAAMAGDRNYKPVSVISDEILVYAAVINEAAIIVTAPVFGQVPDKSSYGTGSFTTGEAIWNGNPSVFADNAVYTVAVTLTAVKNYSFTGGLRNATINGNTATVTNNTGRTVTLSYTFPATESRPKPRPRYSIIYSLNGGTGEVPAESEKASSETFRAASIERITAPEGKQFVKWNTAPDGSGTSYLPGETITMPARNLILFAVWNEVLNGFIKINDGWYYYVDGVKQTGFIEFDNGIWRYCIPEEGGRLAYGWREAEGHIRYFADGGIMLPEGWHEVDGTLRYILDGSIAASGWLHVDGERRYFNEYGVPCEGFAFIDNMWMSFEPGGVPSPAGYFFDGVYYRAVKDGGFLYPEGFYFLDGSYRYILDGSIVAPIGVYIIGDYYRYIEDGGILLPQGFYILMDKWRYILDGSIIAPQGWYKDMNGHTRYVADGGILLPQGWYFIDGAMRYILDGAIPASGWLEVDGVLMLFDEYGARIK